MSNLIPLDLYFNVRACGDQLDEIREAAIDGLAYRFKEIRDEALERVLDPPPTPEAEMSVRMDLAVAGILDHIETNTDGFSITVKTKQDDTIRIVMENLGDRYWGAVNS